MEIVRSPGQLAGEHDRWGETALHVMHAPVALVMTLIAAHAKRPGARGLEGLVLLAIAYLGVTLAH